MNYEIKIEPTANGFSAHVPELPGCIAAAETREETEQLIREAIDFHLEGMMLRSSVLAFASVTAHSDVAMIWNTENTPTLYVEIQAPLARVAATIPPRIDVPEQLGATS